MAKELPYFRFTPQEWQNGDISLERFELRGLFIDICSYYWVKDCSITIAILKKRYSNNESLIQELIDLDIILSLDNGYLEISFLDKQFDILSEARKRRQAAGSKGGKRKSSNAKVMLEQSCSYKDKDKDKDKDNENEIIDRIEEENKGVKKDELFTIFWDSYHAITNQSKTDKDPTLKYWAKMNIEEMGTAIDNIKPYFDSLPVYSTGKPLKKARTYLSDKNYNDEFNKPNQVPQPEQITLIAKSPKLFKGY